MARLLRIHPDLVEAMFSLGFAFSTPADPNWEPEDDEDLPASLIEEEE